MNTNEKIAVVNRYIEAFDKADLKLIKELYANDATVEDPVGSDVLNGIEAICQFYQSALDLGPKLTLTGTPRCVGNAVAFPFVSDVTGMKIEIIDVFEFDAEGKIKAMRAYWGPENFES